MTDNPVIHIPTDDFIAPELREALEELAGQGNAERLKVYWTEGEGAAKIRWGTDGDFMRCVRHLEKYVADPKGYCSDMHVRATGARPGHAAGESEENPVDINLVETSTISEAAAQKAKKTGVLEVQFISPGWGSSGYYSPEVLKEAVSEKVIAKGTHMYADHPTDAEHRARPGRSIKDLMGIVMEDARLDSSGAIVSKVQVVPGWREMVETVAPYIGVSIRGDAKDIVPGSAEGREGPIVEGIAHVQSVDFVTRAGRGGKILGVLEAAVQRDRQLREELEAEVTRMRDGNDEDLEVESSSTDSPGQPSGVTETHSGDAVGTKSIEESEFTRLTEEAAKVPQLEERANTAEARVAELEEQNASRDRRDTASKIIAEADVDFGPLEVRGLLAELPVKESGELDADTFKKTVDEEAARIKESRGAGRISGFGGSGGTHDDPLIENFEDQMASAWGHETKGS